MTADGYNSDSCCLRVNDTPDWNFSKHHLGPPGMAQTLAEHQGDVTPFMVTLRLVVPFLLPLPHDCTVEVSRSYKAYLPPSV